MSDIHGTRPGSKNQNIPQVNILHLRAAEIGIGLAMDGTTAYWVMMLAAPR